MPVYFDSEKELFDSFAIPNYNYSGYVIGKTNEVKPSDSGVYFSFNLKDAITAEIFPKIRNVIFNAPATIVFWSDGTKTVVKSSNEQYDPEKGLAMAISKKLLGNKGHYYETFKKWIATTKSCESCKHKEKCCTEDPCWTCDEHFCGWEAEE